MSPPAFFRVYYSYIPAIVATEARDIVLAYVYSLPTHLWRMYYCEDARRLFIWTSEVV